MDKNGKSIQFYLTNYTINSLLHAYYLNDKFYINISSPLNNNT